mmetsp:Transcript_52965/g.112532  ORF Transcript_52965/g.112532 Transcript_52965/m.112532 type:complete len:1005 (+) Transcript_52965:382-3396(+)
MARHVSTPDNGSRGSGSQNANTPGSQSQGGESVTTEAILGRLAKAKEIENRLETIAAEQKVSKRGGSKVSPGSDEKSQALRLQLCEVLSEVILNDSQISHEHDAVGRLWKNCFYGRINDIRSRIAREKSRAKKRQAGGGEVEAAKRMAADLDRQLKQFLKEAIQLYRYIVERYVRELMPLSQSQHSNGSDNEEEERERSVVVVASLYRMHIHLGDLYRYSSQHKLAEECYLKSAKLAPGTGNPFNQLAVVAQQSQDSTSLIALYYYARSLMAAREPFETSRSNLVRLFESNGKWLEEHSRDDDARSRGIVSAPPSGVGSSKKAQQEWRQRERTAANRKALARTVDLQWAFFRGVSLDGYADGRIDLEGLRRKMAGLRETLGGLIGQASFGEGLLCQVVSILAFSTLGAGNSGKLIAADGFCARRSKDPNWNEGIVMANQALAFGFFLHVCAILARDADEVIGKKDPNKLGSIRSLSPLLLGLRFATSLYEGNDRFHGLPFFPCAGGAVADGTEGSSVHELCGESHAEFWRSIASLANRIDALPTNRQRGDLLDVKDFAEFRGYVPFASFLDGGADADAPVYDTKKTTKYASAEEVLEAFSDKKHQGGNKGVEGETRLKINLILSIADNNTSGGGGTDDPRFLSINLETKKREFVCGLDDQESVSEGQSEGQASQPDQELDVADTDDDADKSAGGMEEDVVDPLKTSYSDKGMALPALLTPAALLAGVGNEQNNKVPMAVAVVNEGAVAKKSSSVLPMDSILATSISELPNDPKKGMDALLPNAFLSTRQPEPPAKAPLPPPPGFAMQPQQQRPQPPILAGPSATGISLAEFALPVLGQAEQRGVYGAAGGVMPQAGPSGYPAPSLFETMNPFAQVSLPSFNKNFVAPNPPPGLHQSGLMNNASLGGSVNLQPHVSNEGGLDPTLDFLLNSSVQSQNQPPTSSPSAFGLFAPPTSREPEDPSESIMKFLFEPSGNDVPSRAGRPLYADRAGHPPGMPQTKNPFAT